MRKILVPIDMSETSEEALAFAVSCPCLENRELLLLHVIDPLDISSLGVLGMAGREDDMRRELKKEARAHLDDLVQRYRRDGLELSPESSSTVPGGASSIPPSRRTSTPS